MIEFNGYLTGNALKCLRKRYFKTSLIFASVLYLTAIIIMTFIFHNVVEIWVMIATIVPFYFIACILIPFLAIKSAKNKIVPKQISIKNDTILCLTDEHGEDSRYIEQVKEIKNYNEYYVIVFNNGFGLNIPPHFICQKNLLSQGTLEDFEALFEGKIIRKTQKSNSSVDK